MLSQFLWRSFSISYGLFALSATVFYALRYGAFTSKRNLSDEDKGELELAQKKYWDLSTCPIPGFRHAFLALRNGVRLHYVTNSPAVGVDNKSCEQNVVIFIHGFPDSYLLWRNILSSPDLAQHTLIAVDLPGYGGSDNLHRYDADTVLEAMTNFILGMRELHLPENGGLIMVTHDWGSIIGGRLASEAPKLADRWIITSAIIPQHLSSNTRTLLSSSLKTLTTSPLPSLKTLKPIYAQLHCSYYIFIFNLPLPLATFFATMGNHWWLTMIHFIQSGTLSQDGKDTSKLMHVSKSEIRREVAECRAASSGPGVAQLGTYNMVKETYSETLIHRTNDYGMAQKIRLYREGLAMGAWEKSAETIAALEEIRGTSSADETRLDDGPTGAIRCPATVIYGHDDFAFDRQLALGGIGDYLGRKSQVLILRKSGHWLPLEDLGVRVIEKAVVWAVEGERKELRQRMTGADEVEVFVDKR